MGSRQWKHWHVCQNWILSLHRNFFWGKEIQAISCFFLGFRRKHSEILANFLGHLCWNCLVSVQMNHLEKKSWIIFFLLWWWAEKIRLLAQKNGRFVETAFYFSTVTFWGKKLTCFSFFGAWTDFSTNSVQKLGANLSELHCRWPDEPFAQNKCFWEG